MNELGARLQALRRQANLSQQELAERLHVSTAAVSKWERGKSLPDIAKVEVLANALDLSVLELMRCRRCRTMSCCLPEPDFWLPRIGTNIKFIQQRRSSIDKLRLSRVQ